MRKIHHKLYLNNLREIWNKTPGWVMFLAGLALIMASIRISNACINPEDAAAFDNFPYIAVKFLVAFDVAMIYAIIVFTFCAVNGWHLLKHLGWQKFNGFFFWAALIHFTATQALRMIGYFTLLGYTAALDSTTSHYTCEELPVSIYAALKIFF